MKALTLILALLFVPLPTSRADAAPPSACAQAVNLADQLLANEADGDRILADYFSSNKLNRTRTYNRQMRPVHKKVQLLAPQYAAASKACLAS